MATRWHRKTTIPIANGANTCRMHNFNNGISVCIKRCLPGECSASSSTPQRRKGERTCPVLDVLEHQNYHALRCWIERHTATRSLTNAGICVPACMGGEMLSSDWMHREMGGVGGALSVSGRKDSEHERHGQDGLQAPASRIAHA